MSPFVIARMQTCAFASCCVHRARAASCASLLAVSMYTHTHTHVSGLLCISVHFSSVVFHAVCEYVFARAHFRSVGRWQYVQHARILMRAHACRICCILCVCLCVCVHLHKVHPCLRPSVRSSCVDAVNYARKNGARNSIFVV